MLTSIVRTTVPLIVGALTTFAATHLGIKLPEEVLTELVTVVVAGIYYTVARFLEERVSPAFGRILRRLGLRGTPKYEAKP